MDPCARLVEPVTQARVVSFHSGGVNHRGRTLDHVLARHPGNHICV